METWKYKVTFGKFRRRRVTPEVMALNKYILYKDIWVTAVVQVPSDVSLKKSF